MLYIWGLRKIPSFPAASEDWKGGSMDGGFHPSLPSIRIFALCVSSIMFNGA